MKLTMPRFSLLTYLSVLLCLPIAIGLVGGSGVIGTIADEMCRAAIGRGLWNCNSDTLRFLENRIGLSSGLSLSLCFGLGALPRWIFLFFLCWILGLTRHPSAAVLALGVAIAVPLEEMLAWHYTSESMPPWQYVVPCIFAGGFAAIFWWLGHSRSHRVTKVLDAFSARRPKLSKGIMVVGAILILGLSALGWSLLDQLQEL